MLKECLKDIINSNKNLIVSGDLSSGKTTNIIFPIIDKLIANQESMFIIDSKEEYINEYYNIVRNNYNVVVINLRNTNKGENYNPLDEAYKLYVAGKKERSIELIEQMNKIIFNEVGNDPFWVNAASSYVLGIILNLFATKKLEDINFKSVLNSISEIEKLENKELYFRKEKLALNYVDMTINAPIETRGGIVATARQNITKYITTNNFLDETTFVYEDIINKPTVVFFITRDEYKKFNNLANMLISELFNSLINNKHNKFNFILDNYDDINSLDNFSEVLSSGPSRDIKFIIATRDIDTLVNKEGNYITKLSNIISIEDKLEAIIDGERKSYEKDFKTVNIEKEFDLEPANIFEELDIMKAMEELDKRLTKMSEEYDDIEVKKEITSELAQFKV